VRWIKRLIRNSRAPLPIPPTENCVKTHRSSLYCSPLISLQKGWFVLGFHPLLSGRCSVITQPHPFLAQPKEKQVVFFVFLPCVFLSFPFSFRIFSLFLPRSPVLFCSQLHPTQLPQATPTYPVAFSC
jgi:hypothetical protein